MKNLKKWKNSSHYQITGNGKGMVVIDMCDYGNEPPDNSYLESEIDLEDTNQQTKDFLKDLSRDSVPHERAMKYLKVISIKNSLPLHERQIFIQAFENGKSGREISRELNIYPNATCNMIKNLREKIKAQI